MLADLTILADRDSGGQLLYVIALIILAVGGAIFEKIKKAAAEAERKRRPSAPPQARPSVPPLARPLPDGGERPGSPPPIAAPPDADRWPPVAYPVSTTQRRASEASRRRREGERPERVQRPRRQPASVEMVRTAASPATLRTAPTSAGAHRAVGETERQVEGDVLREAGGALRPTESLAQLRARQRSQTASSVDPATFRQPTVADLRRAIVLNEVLGPPLALRDRD